MLMLECIDVCFVFFFKQNTAYGLRISDWSSDVCSSDLYGPIAAVLSQMFKPQARYTSISLAYQGAGAIFGGLSPLVSTLMYKATGSIWPVIAQIGRASCRGRGCQYV